MRKQADVTERDYTGTKQKRPSYLLPNVITLNYLWRNGITTTFYDWTGLFWDQTGTLNKHPGFVTEREYSHNNILLQEPLT